MCNNICPVLLQSCM